MKVLFFSSMYVKPGQAISGTVIHRQAVELQRRGVEVRVVCPVPRFRRGGSGLGGNSKEQRALLRMGTVNLDGVEVTYVPFVNVPLRFSCGLHSRLVRRTAESVVDRIHSEFPFDLIHAHRVFPTGHAGLGLGRRFGVPLIVSAVGSDIHTHPRRLSGVRERARETLQKCAGALSVSRALAEEMRELAGAPLSVRVIYRGVDVDHFAPVDPPVPLVLRRRLGLPEDGVGIAYVGHLGRAKGLGELLEGFRTLATRVPDVWLALVGDGPFREGLSRRVDELGLVGRVIFAGARPHGEVADWVNASDLFVLASYNEGLPNVVLEAMACARPVVATDVGGTGEAVVDGETGILVPPRVVKPLAQALESLVASPSLRLSMGQAGANRVRSRFTWGRVGKELEQAYLDVLHGRPADASTRTASLSGGGL